MAICASLSLPPPLFSLVRCVVLRAAEAAEGAGRGAKSFAASARPSGT